MKNTPSLNRTNIQKPEMQPLFPSWEKNPHDRAERILPETQNTYLKSGFLFLCASEQIL